MKKSLFIRILSTIFFALILYYFMLPPINLHAFSFYVYLIIVLSFYLVISVPTLFVNVITKGNRHFRLENKGLKYIFVFIITYFVFASYLTSKSMFYLIISILLLFLCVYNFVAFCVYNFAKKSFYIIPNICNCYKTIDI